MVEQELTDRQGVDYQLKALPYRTLDNRVDGAVITIVDIATQRRKHSAPRASVAPQARNALPLAPPHGPPDVFAAAPPC
jgi:PAS domain